MTTRRPRARSSRRSLRLRLLPVLAAGLFLGLVGDASTGGVVSPGASASFVLQDDRQESGPAWGEAARTISLQAAKAQEILESLPRETFDPSRVVDRIGKDPEALIAFVSARTSWIPYVGILRGPTGVLMDGLGNSFDRAVLLGELLRLAGHDVELALTTPESDALDAAFARVDGSLPDILFPAVGLPFDPFSAGSSALAQMGVEGGFEEVREAIAAERQTVLERALVQAHSLADAVEAATGPRDDAAAQDVARIRAALRENVIVRHRRGADSDWRSVDLLGLGGEIEHGFALDAIPDEHRHAVTIRVVIERLHEGVLETASPLEHRVFTSDVVRRPLSFFHRPLGGSGGGKEGVTPLEGAEEFLPVLAVGRDEVHFRASVNTAGVLDEDPKIEATVRKFGDAQSAISTLGDAEVEPLPPGHWTAQWIDYTVDSPGAPAATTRRQIFDLVGPALRRHARAGAFGEVNSIPDYAVDVESLAVERGRAITGTSDIVIAPCDLSTEFVTAAQLAQLAQNREAFLALLHAQRTGEHADLQRAAARLQLVPTALYEMLWRRKAWSPYAQEIVVDAPLIVASHSRLTGDSVELSVDLVRLPVGVRTDRGIDARRVSVGQGIIDGYLETRAFDGMGAISVGSDGGTSTSELFAQFQAEGRTWETLAATSEDAVALALGRVELPADVEARIADALESGHVIVAPAAAASEDGHQVWSYWSIDPNTGRCTAIGANGWGQASSSYSTKLKGIAIKLLVVANTHGLRLVCLVCKGLVAVELLNVSLQGLWLLHVAIAAAYPAEVPPPSGPPPQLPDPQNPTGDPEADKVIQEAWAALCAMCPGPKALPGPRRRPRLGPPPSRRLPPPRRPANPAPHPRPPRTKRPPPNTMPR